MSPGEREKQIYEFIDRYVQAQRRTPTVGDIIRGSGINAYDEVDQALNGLLTRGLVDYVPATLGGPFTSRQVRLTAKRPRQAAGRSAAPPATPSHPAQSHSSSHAPPPAPTSRAAPPPAHRQPGPAAPPPASVPAAWASAPPAPLPTSAMQQPMPQPAQPLASRRAPHVVRAAPAAAPATPSYPHHPFQDQLAAWLGDTLRRPPVALTLGGLLTGALLFYVAQQQPVGLPTQPAVTLGTLTLPLALIVSLVVPAALGYLVGHGIDAYGGWTARDLVTTAALGAAAGGLAWVWSWVAPLLAPLDRTGIPALLDGVRLLPALLPAAWVSLPGAAAIGLLAGRGVLFLGPEISSPALAILQLLLAAVAPELWLARHGPHRDRSVLVVAGMLLGGASVAGAYLTVPGAFPPGRWWAEAVAGALSGAAAGWVAATIRQRLGAP